VRERTEQLREAQSELLATAREAGMAEIATNVLHNVGNVLNSLNVSVAVVGDRLRQSKVAALGKSVQLFERHPGGLAGLLATDKGKLLPSYLASVSQQLAAENTEVRRELESVARNVDHIKTIVATQQSYARQSAVREPLDLAALVDDAIRMAELSLARHGVEVERAYAERPTVVTDRHRVLQILVNLISNASAAMKQATGVAPRLTFTLARTPVGFALTVADTGIGIEAKHLDQIFRHGFTTKRDGHGFGLHSAANTARELGGSLTAASDGPGRGARFTIELPHEAPGGGHVFHN
jgi:signal transduction histidine kinase